MITTDERTHFKGPRSRIQTPNASEVGRYRDGKIWALEAQKRYCPEGLDEQIGRWRQISFEDCLAEMLREQEERREQEHRELKRRRRDGRKHCWHSVVQTRGIRYEDCRFSNFVCSTPEQRAVVKRLVEWCRSLKEVIKAGENCIFMGPTGSGKDHLLGAILRQAALRFGPNCPMYWTTGAALASHWASKPDEVEPWFEYTTPVRILAISDPCPTDTLNGFTLPRMTALVDSMYSKQRSVFVTCNAAGRTDLEKQLGAPLVDRLTENATIIKCGWGSYRKMREVLDSERLVTIPAAGAFRC